MTAPPLGDDVPPSDTELHFRPRTGRFGDPKPIVHEGRFHVFFQTSPRPDGFDTMRWGHVVSDDLLRWTQLAPALEPEEGGPDAYGCWTGCVLRHEGRFHVFYTGVGGPDGQHQTVCHAESDDLLQWRKDPGNPIVVPQAPFAAGPGAAWRDPQVRPLPDGGFEMVLTAEVEDGSRALRACVARLLSDDLRTWRVDRVLHRPGDVHRCECPEVVRFGEHHLLLYSDYGVQVRTATDAEGPYRATSPSQLDDFRWYAAKSAADGGRRLVFGFVFDRISDGPVPGHPAPVGPGGAADDPSPGGPTDEDRWTWGGAMGFARELYVDAEGRPAVRPVPELERLRADPVVLEPDLDHALGDWQVERGARGADVRGRPGRGSHELALVTMGRQPVRCEIATRVHWQASGGIGLLLYADAEVGSGYRIDLDRARGDLALRRLIPYRNPASPVLQRMPLPLDLADAFELRALVDGSLLELYVADRVAFTARTYDRPADPWWGLTTRGPARFCDVRAWSLALPSN